MKLYRKVIFNLLLVVLILTGICLNVHAEAEIPNYSGIAYCNINKGVPYFTYAEKQKTYGFESYSRLDSFGRCGVAYANVCKEIMPTEERGLIGNIRPSGWHTVKYNDLIDGNYLYNRCHLIGYQLAGENANVKNLITGTRYLNVEGMLPFENKVADYVKSKGNHVLYRVTPKFTGNNLVADGVQIEAWSVEDAGKGICFNVFCYNVQPGITIDYATGDSARSDEKVIASNSKAKPAVRSEQVSNVNQLTADATDNSKVSYIANKNSKKFHYPTCNSVKDMAEHNKQLFNGDRSQLIGQGYVPCKRCRP